MPKKNRKSRGSGTKPENRNRHEDRTRRRRVRSLAPWAAATALLVAAVALAGFLSTRGRIGRLMPDEGRDHVADGMPIRYKHYPPTSGPHYMTPVKWGIYDHEVKEGYLVHNIEHGGMVILYNCPKPCPDLVLKLDEAYRTFPKAKYGEVKIVVAPYHNMEHRIALLAWHYLDEAETFDRDRALKFYKANVDRAPEDTP